LPEKELLKRLQNEELHNLYTSPNIVRETKSRRIRWAGYVERMEKLENGEFWSEHLKGMDHSEDLGVDGKIILEWILEKCGGKE
jgi:hypothetical protein